MDKRRLGDQKRKFYFPDDKQMATKLRLAHSGGGWTNGRRLDWIPKRRRPLLHPTACRATGAPDDHSWSKQRQACHVVLSVAIFGRLFSFFLSPSYDLLSMNGLAAWDRHSRDPANLEDDRKVDFHIPPFSLRETWTRGVRFGRVDQLFFSLPEYSV